MRTVSLPITRSGATTVAVLSALFAVACQTNDLTNPGNPGGGDPDAKITALVVASDVSQPSGPLGQPVTVSGTVTFSGLTVELWDGRQWLMVSSGSGTATIEVGNASASATLVPASEIPAGSYTKVRVSATSAAIDVTIDGQDFSARIVNPDAPPLVIEKAVEVTVNPDGSRTLRVELELVRTVTLQVDPAAGAIVTVTGELGSMSAPAATAPGSVVASDVSEPTTSPAGASVSGTVTFSGLGVDLWDGQQWLAVATGSGSATVTLGDGSASATLVPASEIAAGTYTRVRLTATEAVVNISATLDGREFSAQVNAASDQPLVIEKAVEVTVNPDGSRTFRVELELVRTVAIEVDPTTAAASVTVTGDLGSVTAAATSR